MFETTGPMRRNIWLTLHGLIFAMNVFQHTRVHPWLTMATSHFKKINRKYQILLNLMTFSTLQNCLPTKILVHEACNLKLNIVCSRSKPSSVVLCVGRCYRISLSWSSVWSSGLKELSRRFSSARVRKC